MIDTRGIDPAFTGAWGPPAILGGSNRTFTVSGALAVGNPCANVIPTGVNALSVNVTAANPFLATGDFRIVPGASPPLGTDPSFINFRSGVAIANAGILSVSADQITVHNGGAASGSANMIMDIFGYYAVTPNIGTYGLRSYANTGGYDIRARNISTTCGGTCGISMRIFSTGNSTVGDFSNFDAGTETNTGVFGEISSTGDNSAAILGHVYSASGLTFGVWGISDSATGRGVFGDATATGFTFGSGVYGQTEAGFGGSGVYGLANCAGPGGLCYGVFGDIGSGIYGVYSAGTAYVSGDLTVSGQIFAGTKDFIAPYPGDASKEIRYTSAEAPEALAFVRGKAQVVNGFATISLPDHFRLSVDPDSMTVNLTPIGAMATVGVVKIDAGKIVIQASRDMRVDYVVYGERSAFRGQQAVVENTHFRPQFEGKPIENWPASYVEIMKQNGVLNADGTVNKATAERLGWKLAPQEANPSSRPAPVDSKKVLDERRQKEEQKEALFPETSN